MLTISPARFGNPAAMGGYPNAPISGTTLWIDAEFEITKDGGDLVSAWGNHAAGASGWTQPVGAQQPLWVDAVLNGKPIVRFDGVDNAMVGPVSSTVRAAGACTLFAVFKATAINTANATAYDNDAIVSDVNGQHGLYLHSTAPSVKSGNYDGSSDEAATTIATGTFYTTTYTHNGVTLGNSVNGGATTTVASGNNSDLTALMILGRNYATAYFDGDLAALLCYNTALSAADIAHNQAYLRGRFRHY